MIKARIEELIDPEKQLFEGIEVEFSEDGRCESIEMHGKWIDVDPPVELKAGRPYVAIITFDGDDEVKPDVTV